MCIVGRNQLESQNTPMHYHSNYVSHVRPDRLQNRAEPPYCVHTRYGTDMEPSDCFIWMRIRELRPMGVGVGPTALTHACSQLCVGRTTGSGGLCGFGFGMWWCLQKCLLLVRVWCAGYVYMGMWAWHPSVNHITNNTSVFYLFSYNFSLTHFFLHENEFSKSACWACLL